MTSPGYDVIVIGGGSAGCAVAARLSEDPACQVLLLERGPDPRPLPPIVAEAGEVLRLFTEYPHVQTYPAARTTDGSVFYPLAGHLLGGSSSINFMVAIRGLASDFAGWARATADPAWAWPAVLPVFKRLETDADFGETELHGGGGPLWIKRRGTLDDFDGWERAFIDACAGLGFPRGHDMNGADPHGVVPVSRTVRDGLRQSAAVAYIDPARDRKNLVISDRSIVLRVELSGDRAVGVRYVRDGQEHLALAGEVVVAAGVYHSPQVLMLSGIGPVGELERHGIPVTVPSPGVGENLQDHVSLFMSFEGLHRGPVEWPVSGIFLLARSDSSREVIDLNVMLRAPIDIEGLSRVAPISLHLLEQRNRGRLTLAGPSPLDLPVIEPRMLDDKEDLEVALAGMRLVRRLAESEPLRPYYGAMLHPGPDDDWADFARRTYDSYHHGAGTCHMGRPSDAMAVVDGRLRVRGVHNLRVADASIMPTVVRANTNLTCMMIGERCADFVREES